MYERESKKIENNINNNNRKEKKEKKIQLVEPEKKKMRERFFIYTGTN
jgi:hypothetical protein